MDFNEVTFIVECIDLIGEFTMFGLDHLISIRPNLADDITFGRFDASSCLIFMVVKTVSSPFANIEDRAIRLRKGIDVVFVSEVVLGYSIHGKGPSLSSLGMFPASLRHHIISELIIA